MKWNLQEMFSIILALSFLLCIGRLWYITFCRSISGRMGPVHFVPPTRTSFILFKRRTKLGIISYQLFLYLWRNFPPRSFTSEKIFRRNSLFIGAESLFFPFI